MPSMFKCVYEIPLGHPSGGARCMSGDGDFSPVTCHILVMIPYRDIVAVVPDRVIVTVVPDRDMVTVVPYRDIVTVVPDRDIVTVVPAVCHWGTM